MTRPHEAVWKDIAQRWPWIVGIAAAVLLLSGTMFLPLLDRDEPRFASATLEMIERGEYIVPYFNGAYRFDKPVLTYWLMRVGYAVAGEGELGARLHAVVATVLLCLFVAWWARKWYGPVAAVVAGLGLLTCLQVQVHGRLSLADMPLVLLIAVAHYAMQRVLGIGDSDREKKERDFGRYPWRWFWVLYLAMGVGFLAKGPLALLVPAVTLLLYRFVFWRDDITWGRLHPLFGLCVMLLVVAPWGLLALWKTNGAFLSVGIGQHVVQRGLDGWGGRLFLGPVFYGATSFASLMPWMAFLGAVLLHGRKPRTERSAYLMAWFAGPFLVFSFYATQLMHYPMPGYPGLFLLLGSAAVTALRDGRWQGNGAWWYTVLALYAVVFAGLVTAAVLPTGDPRLGALQVMLGSVAAIVAGFLLLAVTLRYWLKPWLALPALVLVAAGLAVGSLQFRAIHPVVRMLPTLEAAPEGARHIAHVFQEGSLVFYTQERWEMQADPKVFLERLREPGPLVAVMAVEQRDLGDWFLAAVRGEPTPPERSWEDEVRAAVEAAGVPVRVEVEGYNPGYSKWVRLAVIVRE